MGHPLEPFKFICSYTQKFPLLIRTYQLLSIEIYGKMYLLCVCIYMHWCKSKTAVCIYVYVIDVNQKQQTGGLQTLFVQCQMGRIAVAQVLPGNVRECVRSCLRMCVCVCVCV